MDTKKKVKVIRDLSKYKDYFTVGKLRKFLEENPELPDNAFGSYTESGRQVLKNMVGVLSLKKDFGIMRLMRTMWYGG